jgi:hypothetical protein
MGSSFLLIMAAVPLLLQLTVDADSPLRWNVSFASCSASYSEGDVPGATSGTMCNLRNYEHAL